MYLREQQFVDYLTRFYNHYSSYFDYQSQKLSQDKSSMCIIVIFLKLILIRGDYKYATNLDT